MRSQMKRILGLGVVALALATTAQAQGRGHGRNSERAARADRRGDHDGDRDVYRSDVYRRGDQGVYRRDDGDIYGNGRWVPPGLAKKPGQMPPGQYKKRYGANQTYGVYQPYYQPYGTYQGASVLSEILRSRGYPVLRVSPVGESHYVYYRQHDGAQRRAIVSPGTNRLLFNNVPASILQAVLSRLY